MARNIVIIDYGLGNLFSIQNALLKVGFESIVSGKTKDIREADAIILPGMGAFGDAMDHLEKMDLAESIKTFARSGKPFLGVCLGMQLLMEESSEFGLHKGLGLIAGTVTRFEFPNGAVKVPQVGWNKIFPPGDKPDIWKNSSLKDVSSGTHMYFVHSYYVQPADLSITLTETNYEGIQYCSSFRQGNVFASQFHPERSGPPGLSIYKNWLKTV